MSRSIYGPSIDPQEYILPIHRGGTGASSIDDAADNLNIVTNADIGEPLGPIPIISGKIPSTYLPAAATGAGVNAQGAKTVFTGSTVEYKITDFDIATTYTIKASRGVALRSKNIITYTAPNIAGIVTLTINDRIYTINVIAVTIAKPAINNPTTGSNNLGETVSFTSSVFNTVGGSDTHSSSDWQVATDAGFTQLVGSVTDNNIYKTSYAITGLDNNTIYYARCRYKGVTYGYSEWSTPINFRTKEEFVPFIQEAKIVANDKLAYDYFGSSVAVDGSGSRVVIGAYGVDPSGINQGGAIYVYTLTDGSWQLEAKMVPSDPSTNGFFGRCVDISEDGSRIAVGCPGSGIASTSAVYIYRRSGTTWSLEQKLSCPNATGWTYATSIKFSLDASRLVVGSNLESSGRFIVFLRNNTIWSQETIITSSAIYNTSILALNNFTISGDGTRIAVGSYGSSYNSVINSGLVYVYVRSGTAWILEATIAASDASLNNYFGTSVAFDQTGSKLFIGQPGNGSNAASIYVYTRSGTTWTKTDKLIQSSSVLTGEGVSLSVSKDGNMVFAGGHNTSGVFYLYRNNEWNNSKMISNGFNGYTLSLAADGSRAVGGNYNENVSSVTMCGAVYVFV